MRDYPSTLLFFLVYISKCFITLCRGKALNMDHFYKNIRNIFLLQQIGTIFIVSVAYSSVDIVLEH